MKHTLILLLSILMIFSCKKDNQQPQTQTQAPPPVSNSTINFSLVKDVTWHHLTGALATLKFASTGIYYENTTNDGNWTLVNQCDSIYITRPSNNFYYKIISVSSDTLHILNPVFGE